MAEIKSTYLYRRNLAGRWIVKTANCKTLGYLTVLLSTFYTKLYAVILYSILFDIMPKAAIRLAKLTSTISGKSETIYDVNDNKKMY